MAQDFERYLQQDISNSSGSPTVLRTAADSDDAIIGINLANVHTSQILVSVYVTVSSADYYIIKNAPIPTGSTLQVLDGGARITLVSGDALKVISNTANSVDAWISVVDAIST